MTAVPEPRKGMPSPQLDEDTFRARYLSAFADPGFEPLVRAGNHALEKGYAHA